MEYIFLYLHFKKKASRYLLNTQRKVSKKVSKICFNFLRHQKTPKLRGFIYLPQHCLYFFPLPHGTHKSAYFNTLIFLKPFIYGLFGTLYFLILPLKSSVCGSKSGSKTSFFPHLLSFIAISLYHFLLIISS